MSDVNANLTLDAAITQAAAGMESNSGTDKTATQTQADPNPEGAETVSSEASGPISNKTEETTKVAPDFLAENGITKEQFDNAVNLYKAINDPSKAGAVIKYLNDNWQQHQQKAGITDTKEPTIAELLKVELGEEFEPFAVKLAPALEKIVDRKMRPVQEKLSQTDQEKTTNSNLAHTREFANEFLGEDMIPDNIANEMTRIVSIMPPSDKVSVKEYINIIGKLAMQNLNIAPKSKTATSNITPKAPSPLSRLTKSAAKPSEGVSAAPKDMTLDQIVNLAASQIDAKG